MIRLNVVIFVMAGKVFRTGDRGGWPYIPYYIE